VAADISVPDWCFHGKLGPAEDYYETLRAEGVGAVEMTPPERHAAARAAGLQILNQIGPGMQEGLNRREHHAKLLPAIRDAVRRCGDAGIPTLLVFSGNRAGQPDAEGIGNCRSGIEELLPDAERAGVVLGFEMLNSFDHADYQADHGAYGFALAEAVASPRLRIVYDLYHLERMGDDGAADVAAHLPRVLHLHLADSPARDRPKARGGIDYARIIPAIARAGYRGWWGLEFLPGADALDDLRRSIALVRELAGG
jgi:hydroxypyruvate isomerase